MLLERNPLKGLSVPREEGPKRPALGNDEYTMQADVAERVSPQFELPLVLAHEKGIASAQFAGCGGVISRSGTCGFI
ncbi:MAG: hypothetical protein AB1762_07275 [Gemmatimonadota bacterium]